MKEKRDHFPKVCVIIVSYNFQEWIDVCIPSVLRSSVPATILVIDNASTDNTCHTIRLDYPEVQLVENDSNMGFGKANNIGLRYALDNGYDYVFLLNQDASISENTIELLLDAAAQNNDYGILSPVHLNGKGDKLDFGFETYSNVKCLADIDGANGCVVECPFINAAMWFMSIETVRKIGGFAPIFSHYGEDLNYSQRLRMHGLKIGYVPAARGRHYRERRETNRQKSLHLEYVYFLAESVNPSRSAFGAFVLNVLAAKKKAFVELLKGDVKGCLEYLHIVWRLTKKIPDIGRTRKLSIRSASPFLS